MIINLKSFDSIPFDKYLRIIMRNGKESHSPSPSFIPKMIWIIRLSWKTIFLFFIIFSLCNLSSGETNRVFIQNDFAIKDVPDTSGAAKYFKKGRAFFEESRYDSSNYYLQKAKDIYDKISRSFDHENIWTGFISCSNQICLNLILMGEYDSSFYRINETLKLAIEKLGENHPEVASCYYNLGYLYDEKGDYNLALENYQKSLAMRIILSGENNSDAALTYNDIGVVYVKLNKYSHALENHNKALDIRLHLFGEKNAKVSQSYNNIGIVYLRLSDFDKAHEYYQKSLSINLSIYAEENLSIANNYLNIGNVFYYKGDFEKALEYFQKNLVIREKLLGENHNEVAGINVNIGAVLLSKGDYDKALESFQKALSIRINNLGQDHPAVGATYNNIGAVYYYKGDYDKALETYQKSLAIKLKTFNEDHHDIAVSYVNLGNIFSLKAEYEKALEYYNKNLMILNKLYGDDHPEVAVCYNNIGDTYRYNGDLDNALVSYQKSLSIGNKLYGDEHPEVAKTYMNIGIVYRDKNNFNEGINYLQKSLSIRLMLLGDYHPDAAESYKEIAEAFSLQSSYDSALAYCQRSINSSVYGFNDMSVYSNPTLEGINNELYLLNTLKLKAGIFEDLSEKTGNDSSIKTINLGMALSTYGLAVDLINKMRAGYKAEGSKLFLGENVSDIFEDAIHTSLRLFEITKDEIYKHEMFLFSEKSKTAVLQEELRESEAREFSKLPEKLLEEEKQFRIDLAFYDTNLQNEYINKNKDSGKIHEYEDHLFKLKSRYEKFMSEIESNYPAYYDLKYQAAATSVGEIQELLPDNINLLEYFYGSRSIFIFIISKDTFDIITVKKPDDFYKLIEDFYSSIVKSETIKYLNSADKLSRMLISPVLNKINSSPASEKSLVIIPHNLLNKIPFEALFTDEPSSIKKEAGTDYPELNYLIRSFNISYHYSSTLYINSLKKKLNMNNSGLDKFIGFAPVFPSNDKTGYTLANRERDFFSSGSEEMIRSLLSDEKSFNELKFSKWEVQSIIELYAAGEEKGKAYFFTEATENAFKSGISNYEIIHIATHSFINEEKPQISGIVFSQPVLNDTINMANGTPAAEDGILYAGEIYNLDINANLVVLSSCESGSGKLVRGEGLMGFTRGFLYSGADNIVFSLWKIPDKHTSELMVEFYRQIISGKNYSQSLRQAKLGLIKNQLTARPRSWAGFLMIGSD